MKKIFILAYLILSTVAFSQQPFKFDTIRVSDDDARNIHKHQQNQHIYQQTGTAKRRAIQQPTSKSSFNPRNLRYGLDFGLSISNDYSRFRLAPQVGYQFNKYFMSGVSLSYDYSKRKYFYQREKETYYSNSLGASIFGYLYPAEFIVFSVRPEIAYIWRSAEDYQRNSYKWSGFVPSVIIGGGVRFGHIHAMLFYDLVQSKDSPYSSGVFYGVSVYL